MVSSMVQFLDWTVEPRDCFRVRGPLGDQRVVNRPGHEGLVLLLFSFLFCFAFVFYFDFVFICLLF